MVPPERALKSWDFLFRSIMKVVVSSSCRFSEEWPKLKGELSKTGVDLYFPEKQDLAGLSQQDVDRIMETVNREFYSQIDDCDVVYVYCPKGYIGKGVASEIGYAIAKEKEIIASDNIDDLGIWSLVNKVMSVKKFINYIGDKNEL